MNKFRWPGMARCHERRAGAATVLLLPIRGPAAGNRHHTKRLRRLVYVHAVSLCRSHQQLGRADGARSRKTENHAADAADRGGGHDVHNAALAHGHVAAVRAGHTGAAGKMPSCLTVRAWHCHADMYGTSGPRGEHACLSGAGHVLPKTG